MKPVLRKELFWDVDYKSIDYEKNARFVIERVATRGNFNDWNSLKAFYGMKRIKTEIVNIRYLDKVTLSYLSTIFKIKKEKFRCYNMEPSIKALWNY